MLSLRQVLRQRNDGPAGIRQNDLALHTVQDKSQRIFIEAVQVGHIQADCRPTETDFDIGAGVYENRRGGIGIVDPAHVLQHRIAGQDSVGKFSGHFDRPFLLIIPLLRLGIILRNPGRILQQDTLHGIMVPFSLSTTILFPWAQCSASRKASAWELYSCSPA